MNESENTFPMDNHRPIVSPVELPAGGLPGRDPCGHRRGATGGDGSSRKGSLLEMSSSTRASRSWTTTRNTWGAGESRARWWARWPTTWRVVNTTWVTRVRTDARRGHAFLAKPATWRSSALKVEDLRRALGIGDSRLLVKGKSKRLFLTRQRSAPAKGRLPSGTDP
jgi:hypothetical protein